MPEDTTGWKTEDRGAQRAQSFREVKEDLEWSEEVLYASKRATQQRLILKPDRWFYQVLIPKVLFLFAEIFFSYNQAGKNSHVSNYTLTI